jgi:hypothetical protein
MGTVYALGSPRREWRQWQMITTTGSFMGVLLELDSLVKLNKLIATAAPIAMS